jgi:hypothetical protein
VARLASPVLLVLVTTLMLGYGPYSWSWLAGPIAALTVWSVDRKAHVPLQPSPARGEPAPVD